MIRENVVKTINSLKGEEGHKKVLDVYKRQVSILTSVAFGLPEYKEE